MTNGTNIVHEGGCQCGAVTFITRGAPICVANCHCRDCRKATSAAFTTFVDFPRSCVTFTLEPSIFHSSPTVERLFCSTCGTPIGYRGDGSLDEINLYLGAFNEPENFKPTEECHQESALWKNHK
ncbi:MAG: GFA family protein [Marinicaulis sp.]|nr:GFA family protein [Marinicaulis sp.]